MVSVIILDDDPEFVDALSVLLKLREIKVLDVASNGLSALALYKKHKPDFVITDYNMPEYDGLFVIESIKKFDPEARIVLLSGFIPAEIKLHMSSFEYIDILEKPFDSNAILQILK